jgi:hypothetical protein
MSVPNRELPAHVAWLGYGGLLPFVALAALAAVDRAHSRLWSDALQGYGAVILGFVGALHWGFAMCATGLEPSYRRRAFLWSVVPALLSWTALVLAGATGSLLLVAGFVLHLLEDRRLAAPAALPAWYLPLRWRLTAVACLCLLCDLAGRWLAVD